MHKSAAHVERRDRLTGELGSWSSFVSAWAEIAGFPEIQSSSLVLDPDRVFSSRRERNGIPPASSA
jgi:hypothetical protein